MLQYLRFRASAPMFFVLLISFFSVLNSCKREDPLPNGQALRFTSTISNDPVTRVSNTLWDEGDKMGVFMYKNGESLSSASIVNGTSNTPFTYSNSYFKSDSPVFLSGDAVDFIAYYPFKSLSDLTYPIDLSDQSNQSAIDVLYANNAKAVSSNNFTVPLVFNRQLSKLSINLTITNTGALSASGLTATLSKAKTQASLDLTNGDITLGVTEASLKGKVTASSSGDALVEFTLLPGEDISNRTIKFESVAGESFTWKVPTFQTLVKGARYTVAIKIDNGTPTDGGITTQAYAEIPTMGSLPATEKFIMHMDPDNVKRRNYSMLYDTNYKMAYWVAYPLHSSYMGSSGRTDDWQYDPSLDQAFQPSLFSGFPGGGYDRGHQIPSADRTASSSLNRTTFYFSNMTAQRSYLNQRTWANLENKIRTWTGQADTMYVVTGAMPYTKGSTSVSYVKDNAGQDIALPKYYFKALAMLKGGKFYTIGYRMDNVNHETGDNYDNYRVSVADLEAETGFTFFPNLSAAQKSTIETDIWK